MAADEPFLSRWSRKKAESRTAEPAPAPVEAPAVPEGQITQDPAGAPEPLPPPESLTIDSDFKPFMDPEVEDGVRQKALKALFRDPHFNVMDGLDTYIDDYSKSDPMPQGWLSQLRQVARLGDFAGLQKAEEAARARAGDPGQASQDPVGEVASPRPADAPATVPGAGEADREPRPPMHGESEKKPIPKVGESGA